MVCGTFTVKQVPAAKLDETEELFRANDPPPLDVSSTADGSGTFTVVAKFAPCPANTTHDPTGAGGGA